VKTKIVDCTFRLPGERARKAAPDVNCGFDPTPQLTRFERDENGELPAAKKSAPAKARE
jgi:hypothetical protein